MEKANEQLFEDDPTLANIELEKYMEHKRKSALKKTDDRIEYDEHEEQEKL